MKQNLNSFSSNKFYDTIYWIFLSSIIMEKEVYNSTRHLSTHQLLLVGKLLCNKTQVDQPITYKFI